VVSDSTPLIHLAKIGRLELLREFFGEIIIPEAVYRECVLEGGTQRTP
jgi:predicted nucleic acid-binding protein